MVSSLPPNVGASRLATFCNKWKKWKALKSSVDHNRWLNWIAPEFSSSDKKMFSSVEQLYDTL